MAILRDNLNHLNKLYQKWRCAFLEAVEEYEKAVEDKNEILSMKYSAAYRQEMLPGLEAAIQEKRRVLQRIQLDAGKEFESVHRNVELNFSKRFDISTEQIDSNALELLKSGICTPQEIYKLGEQFSTNHTMRRLLGKYAYEMADQLNDPELRTFASEMSMKWQPHLDAVDEVIGIALKGLRGGTESGSQDTGRFIAMSNAIDAELYPQALQNALDNYGDIEC